MRRLALLAVLLLTVPASAHSPYEDWKTRNGVSCCNDQDCSPVTAWMDQDGTWRARVNGRTYEVPAAAVLPIKSPDGRSHACIIMDTVICFVPGEVRS